MPWGRQSGYHNIRNQGADERTGEGFFAWARRHIDMLLKSGGEPSPAMILYTHAIDEELGGLSRPRPGQQNPTACRDPFEGQAR